MRYEEWRDAEGLLFVPDDEEKANKLRISCPNGAELVWWVEAESFEDALRAQHEHHGWDPYVPMPESLPDERTN